MSRLRRTENNPPREQLRVILCCYHGLNHAEKRTASARALTYCDLFVLKKQSFESLLEEFPELAKAMQTAAKTRIESASELVMKGIIV